MFVKCTGILLSVLIVFCFVCQPVVFAGETEEGKIDLQNVRSALLMDAGSGEVLYEKDADLRLPPASVTKIMTLLLTMEALRDGKLSIDEKVTVSDRAAGMGGSQVYLEEGEEMTVREMIKCVVIASANDAAAALAERVGGTLENFVYMMNRRAGELGMTGTHFENTNGLDDTAKEHLTTARDIALMSRELLRHEQIFDYTCIWMDSVRGGAFTLTNTNRLIRYYKGINGLKTGSTSKAGFCISATAKRDGLQLISVIMGAPDAKTRNDAAARLLDYGFANYENYVFAGDVATVPLTGGRERALRVEAGSRSLLLKKGEGKKTEIERHLPTSLPAPAVKGREVGYVSLKVNGKEAARIPYLASQSVERLSFGDVILGLIGGFSLF